MELPTIREGNGQLTARDSAAFAPGMRLRSTAIAVVAVLLLAAAALKIHTPIAEPPARSNWLSAPWVIISNVSFEVFLAIWLLGGRYARAAWSCAIVCFVVFAGVSTYKLLSGASSCGCFGRLHVNPWITAILDSAIVLMLLALYPERIRSTSSRDRIGNKIFILAIALAVVAGALAHRRIPTMLSTVSSSQIRRGSLVVLEPGEWLGKRFPLLEHLDVGSQLSAGRWFVVFFHADCPICQKALPQLAQLLPPTGVRPLLIELPPYQQRSADLLAGFPNPVFAKLSGDKEWFITTPAVILLEEGIVKDTAEGNQVLQVRYDGATHRLLH